MKTLRQILFSDTELVYEREIKDVIDAVKKWLQQKQIDDLETSATDFKEELLEELKNE